MKLTSNPGDRNPADESWMGRRLKALEQRLQEALAAAGELTGATIRRGLMQILDGGGLEIRTIPYAAFDGDPREFGQFRWGALPNDPLYNRPDGKQQMAFLARRDDASLALAIAELNAADGQYAQAVLWFDRAANIIFSEDTNSGHGVAEPPMAMGQWTNYNQYPTSITTSATFDKLVQTQAFTTHPRVQADFVVRASDGTTAGEVRLTDPNGQQVGPTFTVAAGDYRYATIGPVAPPTWTWKQSGTWYLEARVTAGSGNIGVRGTGLWGVAS